MSAIEWYDANAEEFAARTFGLSMQRFRAKFLAQLPAGGAVLDAGCGAGRDALAFLCAGYQVSAFDGSIRLVEIARENTGLPVRRLTFAEMDWNEAFDGVWACATLLHLPLDELPPAMANIRRALRPGGVFFCSFKEGVGERVVNGRPFTDLTLESLDALLARAGFKSLELIGSFDDRPEQAGERWVSAISRRPITGRAALA